MSSIKIHKLKSIFMENGGCGCRPKPADIIEPQTRSKSTLLPSSSASSSDRHRRGGKSAADDDDCSFTTFSLTADASPLARRRRDDAISSNTVDGSCPKIHDSIAVVKDSDDPYRDFRQSMLQMIFEKEIYSRNDLQQLLDCFLKLNSPHHHHVIVRAFFEIWNGGGGAEAAPCSSPSGGLR